jgi:hypothetical protein
MLLEPKKTRTILVLLNQKVSPGALVFKIILQDYRSPIGFKKNLLNHNRLRNHFLGDFFIIENKKLLEHSI